MPSRTYRRLLFTWVSPPPFAEPQIQLLATRIDVRYVIYGREHVPGLPSLDTATPILVGYVVFRGPCTFAALRKALGNPNLHVFTGTPSSLDNQLFCMKGGDYWEYGDLPGSQGKRNDWDVFKSWVSGLERAPTRALVTRRFPGLMTRYPKSLMDIVRAMHPTRRSARHDPTWIERYLSTKY